MVMFQACSRSPIIQVYYPIELGNQSNFFSNQETLFLGQRVIRFRLKLRLNNPGRTDTWVNGVILRIIAHNDTLEFRGIPGNAASDGSFWVSELTGNLANMQIFSNNRVDFQGGQPLLEILEIERYFREDIGWDEFPSSTSTDRVCSLLLSQDVIGFSPGVAEAQHYRIPLRGRQSTTISLYLSPRVPDLQNAMGIRVHLSDTGFVAHDANVAWYEPEIDDSGIYIEFPSMGDKFVTVVSTLIGPYLIRATSIVDLFDNIVIERDEHMNAAPTINLETIQNSTNQQNPFNVQIAAYLHSIGNYDRRIRETLTIASAFSLDGTDGQMRFRSADLYRDIATFRNVDVQFTICDRRTNCRETASYFSINMFNTSLNDPFAGGWTFHHEWGHWQYNLPDEYTDVSGPPPTSSSLSIDPNSLMGTHSSTEFCFPRNHIWAVEAGGEEESCWTQIEDQYQGRIRTVAFAKQSHGRYLDVLHKLDALLSLRVH